ncbi:uncharacterized protein [Macrobrachium rosenbergii]|uniref:uncharacterized protein isoform X2 n=1 Tax=Macrobrachium rosenbergii TaxID=79674 RepID=UPI0034D6CC76
MAASRPVGRSLQTLATAFRSSYCTPSQNALLRNFGYRPVVNHTPIFLSFQRLFSAGCMSCNQQVAHASTTQSHCTPLNTSVHTHSAPATPASPTPTPAPIPTPTPAPPRINRRTELDFEELRALQVAGAISLIDVRHPTEIENSGEIPGAINIPLCKVKVALQLSEEEWAREFCMEKPCKLDRNLVFYARGPNASSAAVEIAHRLGFKKSRHYIGGWEEYCRMTGQPIKKIHDDAFGTNGNFFQDRFDQYFL